MNETNIVQEVSQSQAGTQVTTTLPATCDTQAEKRFGKFKDAYTLYTAYKNLESEFTRRNQELKQAKDIASEASGKTAELENRLTNILDDEEFINKCVANEQVYSRAVLAFLNSRSNNADVVPVLTGGVGQAAALAPKKAKTLEEAKRLAVLML